MASICRAEETSQPNILLILTDDQGWTTLGCYGGKHVPTPHLDRLAESGTRFTDAYVTSQCTPTRATLLSGQYTARHRMWHVIPWYGCPWARVEEISFVEQFPRDQPTIAAQLRQAGYATGMAGKWHLNSGADGNYNALNPESAAHFGFDFAAPAVPQKMFQPGGDRGVDYLTDQTLAFVEQNRERPWFFYLSHHMIHGKVVAPRELEEKYRQQGYGDEGPNRAVYLAGLEAIDRSIGKLIAGLKQLGEYEETVIIYLSDNGGIDWRLDHRNLQQPHPHAPKLAVDIYEYDNAPLRAGKGSIYEGGVRVPLIISWPKKWPASQVITTPVHAVDLAPTCFQLAGHMPTESQTLDGFDLSELITKGADPRLADRPIYQYSPIYDLNWGLTPCASIRVGDFKLIEFFGDRFDASHQCVPGRWFELYDLRQDIGELNDLTETMPAVRDKLLHQLRQWMQQNGVPAPGVNSHYEPARAFETTRDKPDWITAR
ncbi:sulfatase-like hydrolase/transferase [Bremerella volcania]|uniref:sulfatase-like hydrolase/transferase n=1 Tax=Bremerella volcania TaxID=2527984 RepID=UPI0013FCFA20|nr:sulfatase-like hydrolase/transferase [Bremerella volcania]